MMELLKAPSVVSADADSDDGVKCGYSDAYKYDMQKLIAFILGLLAIKVINLHSLIILIM